MNLVTQETADKIVSIVKARANSSEYSLLVNLYEILQKNIKYDMEELHSF